MGSSSCLPADPHTRLHKNINCLLIEPLLHELQAKIKDRDALPSPTGSHTSVSFFFFFVNFAFKHLLSLQLFIFFCQVKHIIAQNQILLFNFLILLSHYKFNCQLISCFMKYTLIEKSSSNIYTLNFHTVVRHIIREKKLCAVRLSDFQTLNAGYIFPCSIPYVVCISIA